MVVLGICVPVVGSLERGQVAEALLAAWREGESHLLTLIESLAGRYVVLFGTGSRLRVVQDATAMRSVCYARRGGVVASHAGLVELALGGKPTPRETPYVHGYPGNLTGFHRSRVLTAGTLYEIDSARVRRHWPRRPLRHIPAEHSAEMVIAHATRALAEVLATRSVRLELTPDTRGRVALACLTSVTGGRGTFSLSRTGPDEGWNDVTTQLSQRSGLPHEDLELPSSNASARFLLAGSAATEPSCPPPSGLNWPDDTGTVLVPSTLTLSGLARRALQHLPSQPPLSAESMLSAHRYPEDTPDVLTQPSAALMNAAPSAWSAFNEYIDTTGFSETSGVIPPHDQFFWEHRMTTWHCETLPSWDNYAEPFCPFNARITVEALLAVLPDHRDQDDALHRIVSSIAPELAAVSPYPEPGGPGGGPVGGSL